MSTAEFGQQYLALALFSAAVAVLWLGAALSGLLGYRAFRQRLDLAWTISFSALAVVRGAEAYLAWRISNDVPSLGAGSIDLLHYTGFYRMRLAALEMLAAFAVLYLFRRRRQVIRRPPAEPD